MIEMKDTDVFTYIELFFTVEAEVATWTRRCWRCRGRHSSNLQICQHFGRHHHRHRGAHAEIKVKATIIRHKNNNKIIKIKFEFEIDNFCSSWNGFSFWKSLPRCTICHAGRHLRGLYTRHGLHLQHGHPLPPALPPLGLQCYDKMRSGAKY